jgi:hypothetical protein
MFQPSRGHPQGVLIHFVSRVKKYLSRCKYQIKQLCLILVCYVAIVKVLILEDGTAGLSRNVVKKLPPRRAQFSNLHKFGVRRNPFLQ